MRAYQPPETRTTSALIGAPQTWSLANVPRRWYSQGMRTAAVAWTDDVDSRTNDYVRRWMRHFAALRATSVEAWVEALAPHVLPTQIRALSSAERDLLVEDRWLELTGRPPREPGAFDALILDCDRLIQWAQQRSPIGAAFVRLGFRAPTDSEVGLEADLQVDGGPEALTVLQGSARVFDDLCLAQECGHEPALVVRPWLEIEPWQELRAFVRDRRLVGLSQRHAGLRLRGLIDRVDALESAAQRLCGALGPRWPLDDLIVDLVVEPEGLQAQVVDLHPWLPWSDAGLFRWDEDRFETYAFRYVP